jgi:23S rRNA (cytosine1962-C5)-methyltransferase
MTPRAQPDCGPAGKSRLRLRVTAAAETILRAGHPWLFAGSVREQNRPGRLGELAVVYDRKDRFLAIGLFDPDSPLRLRVLHAGKPATLDADWWRGRLTAALERRRGLFDEWTTGYRLIHGESDGWPGLVLDRYGTTLVLKIYTAAWLPGLDETIRLIRTELKPERMVLRLSRNIQTVAERDFGRFDGDSLEEISMSREAGEGREGQMTALGPGIFPNTLRARDNSSVTFLETGIRFEANVWSGQKTGFFLDQRENRRRVETLSHASEVLNAFSFSGGFSLYAARGGAKSVTDLDLSAHALEGARRNFGLNRTDGAVARCRHETVQADAFLWLEQNTERKFDLVILDPPSLARREGEREGAIQAYGRLAHHGVRSLRPGGKLVAASCSAHVRSEEFFEAVRTAAKRSGRPFIELERSGHPPDHPVTFPEAEYLKCIYLEIR